MANGQVRIESFTSQLLQDNYLRDPSTRRIAIYLPPDYDRGGPYPVVYLLAGFTGRGTMMLNESAWDENIQQRMDRLSGRGDVKPMIVVMPDCFTRYGGSQYINSMGTGRYEDHVVRELVPWIDANYHTIADRAHRAVAGKSSGGFGALTLGMQNPNVFGLVACHSGDTHFDLCYRQDFVPFLRSIGKYGGVENFIKTFRDIRPRVGDFFPILNSVAMASCYSPNLDSAWGFDLPFDLETGEWNDTVWTRWKAWDPIERVSEFADALRSLRLLYLDCGTRDEFNLQYGARTFCARCKRANIPYHYEEFDDGHRDIQYRYDVSLKMISKVWA